VTWPDIGYAEAYLESYRVFAQLRADGVIPAGVRFQVEYPTPLASIGGYIVPEQQQVLLPSYERAMFADLDRLLAAIPPAEVAVQWDVAVEFGVLEEAFAPGGAQAFDAIVAALARCVDQVPAAIPVGLHLCYGDYGHEHFMQPASLALQVRVVNAVAAAAARPVSFVSFTVPQNQREESYFAPLAGLTADQDTELNFALVPYHPAEQEEGTTADQVRLIDAALAASPGGPRAWGICTECGMGRVDRGDVPALLDLHREIIAAP
jgi:methionine synthase II (cobalamin-independent)